MLLFAAGAPHSIAVAQGTFILGMVLWVARMIAARRFDWPQTPIDLALLVFVAWTGLAVAFSYVPHKSVARLRGVSLCLLVYLVAANVRSRRLAHLFTSVLLLSTSVNLVWAFVDRIEGHGLQVVSLAESSPLRRWGIQEGDIMLQVDGTELESLGQLNAAFDTGDKRDRVMIRYSRAEAEFETGRRRGRVRRAGTGIERLGVEVAVGRNYRSSGPFSHPATYSETLQLLASLAVGLAIGSAGRRHWLTFAYGVFAVLAAGGIVLTATRASLAGLCVAGLGMVLVRGTGRRPLAAALGMAAILTVIGGLVIGGGRQVGFLDPEDGSTQWRLTVWQEALELAARHPLVGIGPDAAKYKWQEWGLFDNGRLPRGHFHSTPVQILVDRGIPALLAWLVLVVTLLTWMATQARRLLASGDWQLGGLVLGAFGAWLGFLISSTVHLNWADSEVMEIAWALFGLAVAADRLATSNVGESYEPGHSRVTQ